MQEHAKNFVAELQYCSCSFMWCGSGPCLTLGGPTDRRNNPQAFLCGHCLSNAVYLMGIVLYFQCKVCSASEEKRRREAKNPPPRPTGVTKTCTRCKLVKAMGDFCQNKRSSDGLYSQCRSCVADKVGLLSWEQLRGLSVLRAMLARESKCGE